MANRMEFHKCFIFILASFIGPVMSSSGITTRYYTKIPPSFPATITNCLMKEYFNNLQTSIVCSIRCHRMPTCGFFCIKDGLCSIFSGFMASNWQSYQGEDAITFTRCYSAYTNLTAFAMNSNPPSFQMTAEAFVEDGPEVIFDGHFCGSSSCYVSEPTSNGWVQLTFANVVEFSEIRLILDPENVITAAVSLGYIENSDYNTELATVNPAPGDMVTIPGQGITGTRLTIKAPDDRLVVCHLEFSLA